MAEEIPVPVPTVQPITIEQRLARIARICSEALFACTKMYEPLDDLEVAEYAQKVKTEVDAIFQDKRITG